MSYFDVVTVKYQSNPIRIAVDKDGRWIVIKDLFDAIGHKGSGFAEMGVQESDVRRFVLLSAQGTKQPFVAARDSAILSSTRHFKRISTREKFKALVPWLSNEIKNISQKQVPFDGDNGICVQSCEQPQQKPQIDNDDSISSMVMQMIEKEREIRESKIIIRDLATRILASIDA